MAIAASRSPTIPAIQLLRALAATAVVAFHVQFDIVSKIGTPGSLPAVFDLGGAGVDLFFVISGFVMVYSSESLFGRAGARRTFLLRRIARIVPLYWAMTSIMLVYVVARGFGPSDASPTLALASYLFIPYWRPSGVIDPLYGVGWTLNYEMFFYVIFALAILARREIAVAGIAVFFAALVLIAPTAGLLPQQGVYLADPLILEFVLGMGIAVAYRAGLRLLPAASILLVVLAIAAMAWTASPWQIGLPRWIGWGAPAALAVAALTLIERQVPVPRMLEELGDASYALYLTHPAIISVARALSNKGYLAPATAPWLYLIAYMAICIATSLVVHRFVEKPMTVAARRVLEGGKIIGGAASSPTETGGAMVRADPHPPGSRASSPAHGS
jgi:peptidoglycan/LPS O-acetylase OafA/YrhL